MPPRRRTAPPSATSSSSLSSSSPANSQAHSLEFSDSDDESTSGVLTPAPNASGTATRGSAIAVAIAEVGDKFNLCGEVILQMIDDSV